MKRQIVTLALWAFASFGHAQMQQQAECSRIVQKNMDATKRDKPEVFATVKTYMFEWSKKSDACVIVVQYRVPAKPPEPAKIQILAMNAVTMQMMEGYQNVYLLPASDTKGIMDATNFLFNRYAK
jgi:hypothetical protein